MAPLVNSWADDPALRTVVVLGEWEPGVPPVEAHESQYRTENSYVAAVSIVRDALWASIKGAAGRDTSGRTVPWFVVVDADGTVIYSGAGGGPPGYVEVRAILDGAL
jgi:hypothetical protein